MLSVKIVLKSKNSFKYLLGYLDKRLHGTVGILLERSAFISKWILSMTFEGPTMNGSDVAKKAWQLLRQISWIKLLDILCLCYFKSIEVYSFILEILEKNQKHPILVNRYLPLIIWCQYIHIRNVSLIIFWRDFIVK